jgi:TetR/AcrR family transcriptional regulator of autoinduction and epiphytic fitness
MSTSREGSSKVPNARHRLMQATAQVMLKEGYAAATSRHVAAKAGVKQALVYYYFPTMDDLFLAVLRAGTEAFLERRREALADPDPLRALWRISSEAETTGLNTEFMALANHRKAIRAELKAYNERVRDIETSALTIALRAHGVDLNEFPPVVISMFLSGLARVMVDENAIGVDLGHEEAQRFMDRYLGRFESLAAAAGTSPVDSASDEDSAPRETAG